MQVRPISPDFVDRQIGSVQAVPAGNMVVNMLRGVFDPNGTWFAPRTQQTTTYAFGSWIVENQYGSYVSSADAWPAVSNPSSLTAAQVGAVAATLAVSRNTLVTGGDSRIANGFTAAQTQQQGYVNNLNALLGDRFQLLANYAVGGTQLTDALAQVAAMTAAGYKPAYFLMELGHNDLAPGIGNVSAATAIARWTAVYSALNALGIVLIQSTSLPSNLFTTAASLQQLTIYNRYLLAQSGKLPGFFCFDGHAAAVDPATGQYLAARTYDGVHPNYEGAWCVAKLGFALLDPIVPKSPRLLSAPNAYTQLAGNPTGNGTGGSVSGSLTGSIPATWIGGSAGAAAAVASQVNRTDGRTGTVTRLAFSAGATAADLVFLESGRPQVQPWVANTALTLGWRIQPTVRNGRHYIVTTAGTSANAADPSAGWSTTIGAFVVDGGATMMVVENIDVGDTVQMVCEIAAANFSASLPGTIRLSLAFYTIATSLLSTVFGNYADATYPIPTSSGGPQVLRTIAAVVPAATAKMIARVQVIGVSGVVVDVGTIEIQKIS